MNHRLSFCIRVCVAIVTMLEPASDVFAAPCVTAPRAYVMLRLQALTQEQAFAARLVWVRRTPVIHLLNRVTSVLMIQGRHPHFAKKAIVAEPVFHWDIPEGTDPIYVAASERAASNELSIRNAGKPFVQRVMERTYKIFGKKLEHWVKANPSSVQLADDLMAIFTWLNGFKEIAPRATRFVVASLAGPAYRVGVRWTMGHFLLRTTQIRRTVKRMDAQGILSSVCLIGEQATADGEAEDGVRRMIELLRDIEKDPRSREPLQMPVKISRLVADFDSANPKHLRQAWERLSAIARVAQDAGVEIVIDGERFKDRQAQLDIFKAVAAELAQLPHLARQQGDARPRMGIAVQTYFDDASDVIDELVRAGAAAGYRPSIRLIKGAYYEEELADGVPVYAFQDETDGNFRAVTEQLMRYAAKGLAYPMIASMNSREQAWAYEVAQREGLAASQWEAQMLYGMAPALLKLMLARGQRVRLYLLFGDDVIQGSQYFSRRLPELLGAGARTRQDHDQTIPIEVLSAIAPVRPAAAFLTQAVASGVPTQVLLRLFPSSTESHVHERNASEISAPVNREAAQFFRRLVQKRVTDGKLSPEALRRLWFLAVTRDPRYQKELQTIVPARHLWGDSEVVYEFDIWTETESRATPPILQACDLEVYSIPLAVYKTVYHPPVGEPLLLTPQTRLVAHHPPHSVKTLSLAQQARVLQAMVGGASSPQGPRLHPHKIILGSQGWAWDNALELDAIARQDARVIAGLTRAQPDVLGKALSIASIAAAVPPTYGPDDIHKTRESFAAYLKALQAALLQSAPNYKFEFLAYQWPEEAWYAPELMLVTVSKNARAPSAVETMADPNVQPRRGRAIAAGAAAGAVLIGAFAYYRHAWWSIVIHYLMIKGWIYGVVIAAVNLLASRKNLDSEYGTFVIPVARRAA